jgi:hypothetical protein
MDRRVVDAIHIACAGVAQAGQFAAQVAAAGAAKRGVVIPSRAAISSGGHS